MLDLDCLHRDPTPLGGRMRRTARTLLLPLLLAIAGGARADAPVPSAAEPAPDAVVAELPFLDSKERNRIYIDLAKEKSKRRLRVLLDTGATFSVFTPGAAREIGVRPRRLKSDPYRRATSLGRDLHFVIDTSSSETGSKTGWDYGLLGGNFLDHYVVELDFPGRRVRFLDPDRYEVPDSVEGPDAAVLPIQVVSSRPGVEMRVNGQALTLLLDTGAPSGMMLSGELAAKAGVDSRPIPGFAVGGVLLGTAETEIGEAARLNLGPFEFERVPVVVAPQGWFNIGYPGDSIVGYDLLAQFTLRIDYARKRLWLRRAPDARMTFFGGDAEVFRTNGVLLQSDPGGVRADVVVPGSAAHQRGLRRGDLFPGAQSAEAIGAAIDEGEALSVMRQIGGVSVAVSLAQPGEIDVGAGAESP